MVNIEKLYDRILDILKDYRCQYTNCDEGGCSLVDVLTPPEDMWQAITKYAKARGRE